MHSYITRAEAQAYFNGRLNTEAWDSIVDDVQKDKSLVMATRIIDRLNYLGTKTDSAQELQFPRDPEIDVPQDVKDATSEIALALLDGVDPDLEYENLFMIVQNYGGIKSTYDTLVPKPHVLARIPSFAAWTYLKPYLRDGLNLELHRTS